jgi:uncharacterized protein YabE (DUF348 family)
MLFENKSKQFVFCLKILLVLSIMTGLLIQFPVFQKTIIVSIDGVEQPFVLKGLYIDGLTDKLNQQYGIDNYRFNNIAEKGSLLADVDKLSISTKKIIKIKSTDEERTITTFATTMQQLIQEVNLVHTLLRPEFLETKIHSDLVLEEKVMEEAFEVEVIENPELDDGVENVLQEGVNARILELFSFVNAQSVKLASHVIEPGTKRIVERGTKHVSIAPSVPSDSTWDKLAFCESGGRWNLNTGNGYYGGIQFSAPTWRTASRAVGLDIPYASDATREEQIMAAEWLQKRSGWGQWPHCSQRLGLL